MDDLESRLDHQLSGLSRVPLADPEPVTDLRRRARHIRVARVLTSVVAVAAAVVVTGAVVVVAKNGSSTTDGRTVQIAAPDFVLGDIDAVVLSSGLDADGARKPLPANLAATVARIPGVQTVSGVVDTFAPVIDKNGNGSSVGNNFGAPPRSPILFSYHEGDHLPLVAGRLPAAAGEIVVDADVLTRSHLKIGDDVLVQVRSSGNIGFKIVGTFQLPGVDLTGVPLAAMSVAYQPKNLQFDRLDIKLKPGANGARVRDAIAAATGSAFTVVPPSVISFPDQRLAQIEIQRAYWALLSPDPAERAGSGDGPPSDQEKANYAKYAELAKHVELRVENVSFLSPDAAAVTYRIYYGSGPSPIINDPQSGTASRVNGHWQLGNSTLCSLAALVGIKCAAANHVTISPPNGYQPVSTLDPEVVNAFETLADPKSTVDQRAAVVAGGDTKSIHPMVVDGVRRDRAYAGRTTLTIAGWKQTAPTRIDVLFSLQTENGPSTPWPSTAAAQKDLDGHWYASEQFACGITGLANGGCYQGAVDGANGSPGTTAAPDAKSASTAPAAAKNP
jgi:hypothetical protein